MVRTGFHSGELDVKRLKSNDKYVAESRFLGNANMDKHFQFDTGYLKLPNGSIKAKGDFNNTLISGGLVGVVSGSFIAGGRANSISCCEFPYNNTRYTGFIFVAPQSIPANAKCVLDLYWTSNLSGITTAMNFQSGVVWDADYFVTSVLVSGSESVIRNYNVSGSLGSILTGNTTYTSRYNRLNAWTVSGVIQKAPLEIPQGDIMAGDLVKVILSRDTVETADNLDSHASLLGLFIEYVEV